MHHFFILHKSGLCLYSRSYDASPLDQSLITGFFSSVSTFTQALVREELQEVVLEHARFVYREIQQYVLVGHCGLEDASSVINQQLADALNLLQFFFGPVTLWGEGFLQLDGFDDVIDSLFQRIAKEPSALVKGYDQIYLEQQHRDHLDAMLASLEDTNTVVGCGTMIMIGSAVLHTRMQLTETRLVQQYVNSRPLGNMAVRLTPVHSQNAWHNMQMIQLQHGVLILLTNIKATFQTIAPIVRSFESILIESNVTLPAEEPPILMRHFATRDSVAFVYHNVRTGVTVSPELRPGPAEERKQTMRAFWWFFSEASKLVSEAGLTDLAMAKDGYRFHARLDGVHEMYVLFSDQVHSDAIEKLTTDIQHKVQIKYA